MKIGGKPELVWVAIQLDDLWLEAKYQSNLEIAGSPRKVYRDHGRQKFTRGRALNGVERVTNLFQSNSELLYIWAARKSHRAKLMRQKENSPDFRLRPLNLLRSNKLRLY